MTNDEAIAVLRMAALLGCDEIRERTEEAVEFAAAALRSDIDTARHGYWKVSFTNAGSEYHCSECGKKVKMEAYSPLFPFCPHCGTHMKEMEMTRNERNGNDIRMLGLSMAHLSVKTVDDITSDPAAVAVPVYLKRLSDIHPVTERDRRIREEFPNANYGFFVSVPGDWGEFETDLQNLNGEYIMPDDLKYCLRFAYDHKYEWIMFDSGESEIETLRTYGF